MMENFANYFANVISEKVGPKKKFKNYTELAYVSGVAMSSITYLKQGKTTTPSVDVLGKLSNALEIDLIDAWKKIHIKNGFLTQEKEEDFKYPPGAMPINSMKNWQKRPIFDAHCGDIQMYLSHGEYPVGFSDEFEFIQTNDPNSFLVRANGDSMTGTGIEDGDLLLVEPNKQLNQGNICFCFIEDQGMTVKRFYEYGDTVVLRPANEKYEEIKFSKTECADQCINCYPVTSITRKTY